MSTDMKSLNDHLFAQMERLSKPDMSVEEMELEAKRSESLVSVSDKIIQGATLTYQATKLVAEHGDRFRPVMQSMMIEHKGDGDA